MNLHRVETTITNLLAGEASDNFLRKKLLELVKEIKDYREKEDELESVNNVLSIVNQYSLQYITLIDKFPAIDEEKVEERIYLIEEVLCILSCLETYLFNVLDRDFMKFINKDNSDLYKKARELNEKKTFYKEQKMSWITTLKTIRDMATMQHEKVKMKHAEDMIR